MFPYWWCHRYCFFVVSPSTIHLFLALSILSHAYDKIVHFIEGHLLYHPCIAFKQYNLAHSDSQSVSLSACLLSLSRYHTEISVCIECIRSSVFFHNLLPKILAHTHTHTQLNARTHTNKHDIQHSVSLYTCLFLLFRILSINTMAPSLHTWTNNCNLKISNNTFGLFLSMSLQHSDTLYVYGKWRNT